MDHIILKSTSYRIFRHFCSISLKENLNPNDTAQYPKIKKNVKKKTKIHPYANVHPWKSKNRFVDSMLNQIIYNKDGLVAINKPYGISARPPDPNLIRKYNTPSGIPFEVNYTLTDALPNIAKVLGYKTLTIVKTPERFTTGVVLLSDNDKITQAVDKSMKRAEGARIIPRTYWTITRRQPIYKEGERRVALKLINYPNLKTSEPHIVSSWSKNERDRGDIKVLNVQFKILSTGTHNLSSLLEIKSSTSQWHAVRLFAATILMSPILGDRIYGSRVQNVMGKFMKVSAFVEAAHVPPILDKELLPLLKLKFSNTTMIPAHVHLREMFLPSFRQKHNDIEIVAPPQPEFLWTCKQMKFNEKLLQSLDPQHSHENNVDVNISNSLQCAAIT